MAIFQIFLAAKVYSITFMSSSGLNLAVLNTVLNAGSITSGGILSIQSGGAISNISSSRSYSHNEWNKCQSIFGYRFIQ